MKHTVFIVFSPSDVSFLFDLNGRQLPAQLCQSLLTDPNPNSPANSEAAKLWCGKPARCLARKTGRSYKQLTSGRWAKFWEPLDGLPLLGTNIAYLPFGTFGYFPNFPWCYMLVPWRVIHKATRYGNVSVFLHGKSAVKLPKERLDLQGLLHLFLAGQYHGNPTCPPQSCSLPRQ